MTRLWILFWGNPCKRESYTLEEVDKMYVGGAEDILHPAEEGIVPTNRKSIPIEWALVCFLREAPRMPAVPCAHTETLSFIVREETAA